MKRLSSILLLVCILLSLLVLPAADAAQDATVYVRKHVSILYDNSGSMKEKNPEQENFKWSFASYAAQMFTGLLNDTDTLSITFMEGASLNNIDLKGLRQDAVSRVLESTSTADADTPIDRIQTALTVLQGEGLKPGLGTNEASEQYWLVLTTDGVLRQNHENLSIERVVSEFEKVLEDYPDLHFVYFGIGTENDKSDSKAVDFRKGSGVSAELLNRLHSHANFEAVYAENHGEIVSTMQELSNRISGRYSVSDEVKVNGSEVKLYLSGEGSPIRNIALMAQESNAKLVSATAENGTKLTVDREAEIRFPYNPDYDNYNGQGGYTALITGPNGEKVPDGGITLTFSEPVNAAGLSLMYEPAIHIRFNIERKNENGEWVALPDGTDPVEGDEIRVSYAICEDGTDKELDAAKLFGKTEATLRYNGKTLQNNESVVTEAGDALLDVDVSMMDGGYRINASRTIHVRTPGKEDLDVEISEPLSLYRSEAAENTDKAVQFTVRMRGEPITDAFARDMSLQVRGDAGKLKGKTEQPETNIFRFTPQDDNCAPGTYTVELLYKKEPIAEVAIEILPNETTYTAEAGPSISIMSNRVADNTDAVTFTVTAHRDEGDGPITAEEAELFTLTAERDGKTYNGTAGMQDGVFSFVFRDANAAAGDYDVKLCKDGEVLAQTHITVIHYDANYTVETVVSDPDTVNRFDLPHNQANVSFIIYEDGVPCGASQLEAMLGRELIVTHDMDKHYVKVDTQIGIVDGKPAVVCTPTSTSGSGLINFFRRFPIALNGVKNGEARINMLVEMPHGDSGEGVLNVQGDGLPYILILIALAVVLFFVGLFIFNNLRAARLYKAKVWRFTMRYDESEGGVKANRIAGTGASFGWGWRWMPLYPKNECHSVGKLRFEAVPTKRGRRRGSKDSSGFKRCHPTVILTGTRAEVEKFYRAEVYGVAEEKLEEIRKANGVAVTLMNDDCPMGVEEIFFGAAPMAEELFDDDSKKHSEITVSHSISAGKELIYEESGGDPTVYNVWVYEAKKSSEATAKRKPRFRTSGKKKPAGKSAADRARSRRR